MKAFIAAAGRGRRMMPLTAKCPKALLEVGGKPLIVHHLARLRDAGVRDIVINCHHLADMLMDALGDGGEHGVRIQYSREAELLETGGGIIRALPMLGDAPFVMLSADIHSDYPLSRLADMELGRGRDAHLVLVPSPPHNPDGDFALDGELARPAQSGRSALTYSGMALVHPRLALGYPRRRACFALAEAMRHAAARGRLGGELYRGLWHDIGTPQRLATLQQLPGAGGGP